MSTTTYSFYQLVIFILAIVYSVVFTLSAIKVCPFLLRRRKVDDFIRPLEFKVFYWMIMLFTAADVTSYWLVAIYLEEWRKE